MDTTPVNRDRLFVFQGIDNNILDEQITYEPPLQEEVNLEPTAQNLQTIDEAVELRRSSRTRKPAVSSEYIVYLQEFDFDVGPKNDPSSFSEAVSGEDSTLWYDAMKEEM